MPDMVTVEIQNVYSDGYEATRVVDLPYEPLYDGDVVSWFEEVVWPETGCGHQADGACYTATIVDGPEVLKGQMHEWVG